MTASPAPQPVWYSPDGYQVEPVEVDLDHVSQTGRAGAMLRVTAPNGQHLGHVRHPDDLIHFGILLADLAEGPPR